MVIQLISVIGIDNFVLGSYFGFMSVFFIALPYLMLSLYGYCDYQFVHISLKIPKSELSYTLPRYTPIKQTPGAVHAQCHIPSLQYLPTFTVTQLPPLSLSLLTNNITTPPITSLRSGDALVTWPPANHSAALWWRHDTRGPPIIGLYQLQQSHNALISRDRHQRSTPTDNCFYPLWDNDLHLTQPLAKSRYCGFVGG